MGKYFTVEIKPTIPNVAAGQHSAFSDNDLLFDWFAFDVPRGANKLISMNYEARPKGDAGATVNEFGFDLLIAKTVNERVPTGLGTVNSALSSTKQHNHIVGGIQAGSTSFVGDLDHTAFSLFKSTLSMEQVIEGEPNSGTTAGFDKLYIAGIAAGAFDFRSSVLINNGTLDGDRFTVDGVDPRLAFAIGDVIAATTTADTSVSKSLGTIKEMPDANTIVLESTTTESPVNNDIIYNTAPIRIILSFEK